MKRAFFAMCVFSLLASACTQRTICPAFQSAYIYDQEALRKKFSYFEEDSTPKILTASKNKYLVADDMSYRRRLTRLATVEMKDVQPVVPDSLLMEDYVSKEDLDSAARSIIDSTYIVDTEPQEDSVDANDPGEYVITKDKEVRVLRYNKDSTSYKVDEVRYNNDQDTYMWYLRDVLVLPDIRLLQLKSQEEAAAEKKARKGGFFRNLFKKKKKKEEVPVDTTKMESPVERSEYDLDYVEDEETKPQVQEVEEEKKGLFGRKKKKKKDEGKVSTGNSEPTEKPKKEKKAKKEKVAPEDDKPADEEVKGDEGF